MKSFCNLYLVRHGETDWNAQKRAHGHSDIPLNKQGEQQAAQVKALLASIDFDIAFCSDLLRAHKTAEIILESTQIPLSLSVHLRERAIGSLEGKSSDELDYWLKKFCESSHHLSKEEYLSHRWHPEVESSTETYTRVIDFLKPQALENMDKNVLVVTHGGVIRSILDHCYFSPGFKWVVSNCGYIHLQIHKDELIIQKHHGVKKLELLI